MSTPVVRHEIIRALCSLTTLQPSSGRPRVHKADHAFQLDQLPYAHRLIFELSLG